LKTLKLLKVNGIMKRIMDTILGAINYEKSVNNFAL
jgi:hypothetical protein